MEITPAGRKAIESEQQKALMRLPGLRRWDKRWRVIIFDIPERHRATRDRLRTMLRSLGFVQLQASVWVYPHDCEDLIALLKADFHAGDDMLYMIVDTIERDSWLRKHFGLTAEA